MSADSELPVPKRTMFDICAEALRVLQQESVSTKTQLAQRCKLDTRTTKYIDLLLGIGLIEQFERGNHLRISDKGKEFLKAYTILTSILNQDQFLQSESSLSVQK